MLARAALVAIAATASVGSAEAGRVLSQAQWHSVDRGMEALGLTEQPAADLGYGLALDSFAFESRYNRTRFTYTATVTGADDLTYVRIVPACDIQLPILDNAGEWQLSTSKHVDGLRGYRHFGLPSEQGTDTFNLYFSGEVVAGDSRHELAGRGGYALVDLQGPACPPGAPEYPRVTPTPVDIEAECGSAEADAALATPADATDDDADATRCTYDTAVRRTYAVTDDATGLTTEHTVTVNIVDKTMPDIAGIEERIEVECGDAVPDSPDLRDFVSDACVDLADLEISAECKTVVNSSCPAHYVETRTFTAVDLCGNTACHTQSIVHDDTVAPTITVPPDAVAECVAGPRLDKLTAASATVGDACDDDVDVGFRVDEIDGCGATYQYHHYWTATDDCGNEATADQTTRVEDNAPPSFDNLPADDKIPCEVNRTAEIVNVTATDACAGQCVAEIDVQTDGPASPECPSNFTETRSYTADDGCGNVVTATQTVEHVDDKPPMLEVFGEDEPQQQQCLRDAARRRPRKACVIDNCSNVTVAMCQTVEREPGACVDDAVLVREYTAIDKCGLDVPPVYRNTIVRDTTAPVFAAVDQTVVQTARPGATDNCGGDVNVDDFTTTDPVSGDVQHAYLATDRCGNSAWLNFTVSGR